MLKTYIFKILFFGCEVFYKSLGFFFLFLFFATDWIHGVVQAHQERYTTELRPQFLENKCSVLAGLY